LLRRTAHPSMLLSTVPVVLPATASGRPASSCLRPPATTAAGVELVQAESSRVPCWTALAEGLPRNGLSVSFTAISPSPAASLLRPHHARQLFILIFIKLKSSNPASFYRRETTNSRDNARSFTSSRAQRASVARPGSVASSRSFPTAARRVGDIAQLRRRLTSRVRERDLRMNDPQCRPLAQG